MIIASLIVMEDAVTMTTASLQDSTEKTREAVSPSLLSCILYPVSGGGEVYGLCLAPTINIERTSSEKTQNFCHRVQKLSILTGDCY